ncbi:hypothetical protein [Streptomyces albidochromogenes]|uniref:Uncharacterized protein n=1 Tax=Streptomyces albidochromogenes TaxID=329524 RepID=A0ABW6FPZ0_9ACTN
MTARPTNDLFVRYMKAFEDSTTHVGGCAACQADEPCEAGAPIHERFAKLQDTYNSRPKKQC